jgi:RNA polymerase sigma factor (sigma-70 family)
VHPGRARRSVTFERLREANPAITRNRSVGASTEGFREGGGAELSDAQAVARSLAGEPELFAAVFDRHYDAVHRYVQRRCGERADDVSSETFLAAFGARARWIPDPRGARPWLLGIATNMLHRHARDEQRWLRQALTLPVEAWADEWEERLASRLDAGQQRAVLVDAILGLSPDDRDTLLLRVLAELGNDEVAIALGVPRGTVASRMNRIRRLLASRLAPDETPCGTSSEVSPSG